MNWVRWMVAVVAVGGVGAACADTLEEAVGNTVVVRLADGSEERYYFEADGTFTASFSEGSVEGTWALNGGDVCISVADLEPICEDYRKGKKLGDTWTEVDDDDGSTLTISIVPRR